MMKIGFIGLGAMGRNMALNILAKEGYVCVNDVSADARAVMKEKGAEVAASNAEPARACDIVMLSLPNGKVVESVIFSPGGLVEGLGAGKIVLRLLVFPVFIDQGLHISHLPHQFLPAALVCYDGRVGDHQAQFFVFFKYKIKSLKHGLTFHKLKSLNYIIHRPLCVVQY